MLILRKLFKDERGATAIEYALIAAFVALIIIPGVKAVGPKLSAIFTSVSTNLK
jgi:pilus assembly protein Flp/PilA